MDEPLIYTAEQERRARHFVASMTKWTFVFRFASAKLGNPGPLGVSANKAYARAILEINKVLDELSSARECH